jgi:hypothetical protein
MKHALTITAALALSACATTADLSRISDQTYDGGKGVAVSPIPPPRPVRTVDPCRIWNDRPSIFDECGGDAPSPTETPPSSHPVPTPTPAPHPETPKPVEPPKGNPGNHKPVGNAGETPNNKPGWGAGDRGKSR